jgi:hypothetical protein
MTPHSTGELVDLAALLPEPGRWQRFDHHDTDLGDSRG